jgi:hypothetical protein
VNLEQLVRSFRSRFNQQNFIEVFFYLDQYLDVDKSTQLGRYYCQELYAHFCAKVKLLVDWEDSEFPATNDPNSQKEFTKYMMSFSGNGHFKGLTKADFCFTGKKTNANREKVAPKTSDLATGRDYFFEKETAPPSISIAVSICL